MRSLKTFQRDEDGAVLIEFSVVMILMFLITFSIVEFALVFNKYNSAEKATQVGARIASSRLILENRTDCGVSTNLPAGTDCISVPGSVGWSVECTGAGGGDCNAQGLAAVVSEMQAYYPEITASDIRVRFEGTGLGFVGRGRPIPAVTVSVENITYDFVAVSNFVRMLDPYSSFADTLNIATAQTTIIAEDLRDGDT